VARAKKATAAARPSKKTSPNPTGGTAFTASRVGQLLAHVRQGMWRETAAPLSGIGDRTLRRWAAKGRDEIEKADKSAAAARTETIPKLGRYGQFLVDLLAAEAEVEASAIGVVLEIANSREPDVENEDGTTTRGGFLDPSASLRAATWFLERRNNLRYGRGSQRTDLTRVNVGGDDDGLESEDVGAFVLAALSRALSVEQLATKRAADAEDE